MLLDAQISDRVVKVAIKEFEMRNMSSLPPEDQRWLQCVKSDACGPLRCLQMSARWRLCIMKSKPDEALILEWIWGEGV